MNIPKCRLRFYLTLEGLPRWVMSDAGSAETAAQLRIAWAGRGPIAHVHGLNRQTPVQTWAKKPRSP
jgi:hypothetical protein